MIDPLDITTRYNSRHHAISHQNLFIVQLIKSSLPELFCRYGVLKNFAKFTGKHLYQSHFFNKVAGLRPQVFSCEFSKILKNTLFYRTPPAAAFDFKYTTGISNLKAVRILTHSVPVMPSYRNQLIDLLCISIDWFLYEGNTGT